MNNKMNFKEAYNIYKKLPLIYAISCLVAVLAWGIIDACLWITEMAYDLEFFVLGVWLIIGLVSAAIVFFVTKIVIAPTVLRTDAALAIEKSLTKDE